MKPMIAVRSGGETAARFDSCRCRRDFDGAVGVAPQEWDTGEPVFCVDCVTDASKLLRRQDAGGCGEFGAGDFSTDGAGGDLDLRVVADALVFPGLAAGHQVELVVVFGKPDGRVDGNATFSEGGETDVTLAVDFGGDGSHLDILNRGRPISGGRVRKVEPKRLIELARGHIQ
jgi:hypothetical protein